MRAEWIDFVNSAGAVLADQEILHFGDPERELRAAIHGDILCDLSQQGLIAAQGEDTQTFLQGQLTNDVRQVTLDYSQLSAYCNPKGRVLACLRLFQRGDVYYLCIPHSQVEPLLKRLRMFVLRAKVNLRDASDELVRIGLAGLHAETALHEVGGTVPTQIDQVSQVQGLTAIRLPGHQPRFEIHGEAAPMQALWTRLREHQFIPVGSEPWRLLDILAGIPSIYTETSEAFVPQMVNLQFINGISFRKGCYTGQEIIARTQYLGNLKRRMYRAHINVVAAPRPGDDLFSPQAQAGVGKIVAACRHPEGGYEVLAVVAIESAETSAVALGNVNGPLLEFRLLPYLVKTN